MAFEKRKPAPVAAGNGLGSLIQRGAHDERPRKSTKTCAAAPLHTTPIEPRSLRRSFANICSSCSAISKAWRPRREKPSTAGMTISREFIWTKFAWSARKSCAP